MSLAWYIEVCGDPAIRPGLRELDTGAHPDER
jgi:hypothetical protein